MYLYLLSLIMAKTIRKATRKLDITQNHQLLMVEPSDGCSVINADVGEEVVVVEVVGAG